MTNTIPNVPRELKPCPFCGGTPELPNGDGTQYEIECGGCGQAKAGVQICDLMTLEERVADTFTDYRYGEEFVERAKVEAIERWNIRAPSPAGVDVALSSEQILAVFERNGFRIELGAPFSARGQIAQLLNAVSEIERLSDATAIIDGLRGELRSLEEYAAGRMNKNHDLRQQLNRQDQRIAELEAVMRAIQRMPADDEFAENVIGLIDATLAAVCAAAPNIAPTSEHSGS